MVKIERSYPAPASLAIESQKKNGKYNGEDVIRQLVHDFHDKCYICEMKPVTDVQVEHLLPHRGGEYRDRKFDWDNLFLSCPHCNQVKNKTKYDAGIIDCCKEDPEEFLLFRLENDSVVVRALSEHDGKAQRTADLVEETFHCMNTGSLTHDSEVRLQDLQKEMNVLYTWLGKYKNDKNGRAKRILKGLLSRESAYAGFKRSYIRLHKKEYPELDAMISA